MFSGIIEDLGKIVAIRSLDGGLEFDISWSKTEELGIDDSISINGVCQTVVKKSDDIFTVQAIEETLRKTSFGDLKEGDHVNLERSLTLADRIDGHIVQGHVDTKAEIVKMDQEGTDWLIEIAVPEEFADYIVGRGSIAVDGISLTVARDLPQSFMVAIIPYTYENTVLKDRKAGDFVNLEFDILGKYVLKYLKKLNQ